MHLPIEAPSNALPKSMLQEVQTIRRWDGLEPVPDWSGGEAMELGEESGRGEGRGSRGRLELKAADGEPREPQTKWGNSG